MRPELPRPPARPAASGAAEEARPLASQGDAAARRRDDGAGKRHASASRLLGSVTRHLQEDVENELSVGEQSSEGGHGVAASAAPAEFGGAPVGRVGGGSAKPRRTVRRAGASSRRSASETDDIWAQGMEAADATAAVAGPEARVQPHRRVARVDAVQPDAGAEPSGIGRRRFASWGALLAAVVALVAMLALGWFERLTNAEGNGPEERPAAAGKAEQR